jgi:SSS family solute:Na+ symporter
MTDQQVGWLARIMVLVLTAGAMFLAIHSSATLVSLLLLGYDGVAQLFPGVVLGLFSRRVTAPGVLAGLATGISLTAALILTGRDPYHGLNAGFIALCFNFAVTVLISLATPVHVGELDETLFAVSNSQSPEGASLT